MNEDFNDPERPLTTGSDFQGPRYSSDRGRQRHSATGNDHMETRLKADALSCMIKKFSGGQGW